MAVLGMRGTGEFSSDDRPKNYRGYILYLKPNTKAPLTGMTGQLKEEPTDDPEFKVFTKGLPDQRGKLSGAHSSGTTTLILTVSGDEKKYKKGHVVINERSLEIMWVTADPTIAGQVPVARGKSGTSAAAGNDQDGILVIGTAHEEGSNAPTAVSYDTVVGTNFTQIFRTAVSITRTAKATKMRWGNPWQELGREGLEIHGIELERGFFFGGGQEDTSGAKPKRTTKGLLAWITTNVVDYSASGVSEDLLENNFEPIFRNGSRDKAMFLGGTALNVINKVVRRNTQFAFNPVDPKTTYGLEIENWQTPYGTIKMIQHPLFSENPTFRSWAFIVDTREVVYRPMVDGDTVYKQNIQANDADARVDEYLTECGLELHFEGYHGIWKSMTTFAA